MSISNYTTAFPTAEPPAGDIPPAWGFISAGIAVFFFGSNFVPVKKFETGDGMFFQWVLCAAIWVTGLVVHCIRNFPPFYPLAMLGGLIWETGNLSVVPIIKTIGLGRGILIWGSFNLLAGWASSRYGWFGMQARAPGNITLNYIGMGMCFASAFIYLFIKSAPASSSESTSIESDTDPLLPKTEQVAVNSDEQVVVLNPDETFIDRMSARNKQIFGTVVSMFAGILYGLNFTPVIYIQDNYNSTGSADPTVDGKVSQNGLDYVFAHFCGIFLSSTFYFVVYCVVMKNRPRVYPRVILPGLISGVMWAIADSAWFVANAVLSEAISFPIVASGPGVIGALWGVLAFREIQGKKNLILLCCASAITIGGSIATGFSK